MSGVSASSEIADVATTFGWSWDDVQTVTERALAAAFLPEEERDRAARRGRPPGVRRPARLTPGPAWWWSPPARESRERSSLLTWAYRHIGRSSSRTVCPGMSASVQIPRSIPGRS